MIALQTYNLSKSLAHHKNTIRSIACNANGVMVLGSFDKTCSIWNSTASGEYNWQKDTFLHDDYIYVVHADVLNRGFFTGSKDKRLIYMDNEGNPWGEFIGHDGTVCSISQHISSSDFVVSGSWDATARVWNITSMECTLTFSDHTYAVTVLALEGNKYITGSQKKELNFWTGNKKVKTIDNAHDDIVRSITLSPDQESVFTCSNDMFIKQWTLEGMIVNSYEAHEGFIFSLCCHRKIPKLFSSADDRWVKIWKLDGGLEQSLLHPNTVWSSVINPWNNDLITACADSIARVFSNDNARWMPQAAWEEYTNLCNLVEAQNEGGMGEQVEIDKLPKIEEMIYLKDIKDGEIRLFNNNGKGEAYCFKKTENKWELLGEVMGKKSTKERYEGDKFFSAGEYDYVFSVELEGGTSWWPFNEGDNPLVAAQAFVNREQLHKGYVDDVAKFWRANTGKNKNQKKVIEQKKDYDNKNKKEGAYAPRNISHKPQATQNFNFPNIKFYLYESVNSAGPLKKITELNSAIQEGDTTNKKWTPVELKQIGKVLDVWGKPEFYHNSKIDDQDWAVYLDLFTSWHGDYLVPIFDTYRMLWLHPQSKPMFVKPGGGVQELTIMKEYLKSNSIPLWTILSIRILSNMFNNDGSKMLIKSRASELFDLLGAFVDSENKQIRSSMCSLLFNYSIIYSTTEDPEIAMQFAAVINEVLLNEKDGDNLFLLFQALGNLFCLVEKHRIIGRDIGIVDTIDSVQGKDRDDVKELEGYIKVLLN